MSQLDSQESNIGGHVFKVFKLPPLDAQDVLIDIGQVLAPALGKAANVIGSVQADSVLDLDMDDPKISTGIAELSRGVTKDKMRQLIKTMAGVSWCDGKRLESCMEVVFRGDLPLMYRWLWFALVVNFGNFWEWAVGGIGDVSKMAKAAQSQPTSGDTGQQ